MEVSNPSSRRIGSIPRRSFTRVRDDNDLGNNTGGFSLSTIEHRKEIGVGEPTL